MCFSSACSTERLISCLLRPAGLACSYIRPDCGPLASTQTHTCMHVDTHRHAHIYRPYEQTSGGLCHLWLDTLLRPSGFRNVLNSRKVERLLGIEGEGSSIWKNTGRRQHGYSCSWYSQLNGLYQEPCKHNVFFVVFTSPVSPLLRYVCVWRGWN